MGSAYDEVDRERLRSRLDAATADLDPPFAVVDLDAFDANASDLVRRAGGTPVRVASKSVRCRALLERVLARDGFRGVMAYSLAEALWLVRAGTTDDVLLAYPTADRSALRELLTDPALLAAVAVVVDSPEQLDLADAVVPPGGRPAPLRVCLELDTSWRPVPGLRIGARRSPLHSPAQLLSAARAVVGRPGARLVGLMAYEAHVAGVGDAPPGRPLRGAAVRAMQSRAVAELAARRAAAVEAVREVADLELVDAGGTGSLETAAAGAGVTEVAAGSGLLAPTLFDGYRAFRLRPAALFALPVVRRPGPGVATCFSGGYVASGPAGADRLPTPYLPVGLRLDAQEGAGEVQTPVLGAAADRLRVGDRVWWRHAKAGELCERFARLHLVGGDLVTGEVPTYRGEGRCFG